MIEDVNKKLNTGNSGKINVNIGSNALSNNSDTLATHTSSFVHTYVAKFEMQLWTLQPLRPKLTCSWACVNLNSADIQVVKYAQVYTGVEHYKQSYWHRNRSNFFFLIFFS